MVVTYFQREGLDITQHKLNMHTGLLNNMADCSQSANQSTPCLLLIVISCRYGCAVLSRKQQIILSFSNQWKQHKLNSIELWKWKIQFEFSCKFYVRAFRMSRYEAQICRESPPYFDNENVYYNHHNNNNNIRLMDVSSVDSMFIELKWS